MNVLWIGLVCLVVITGALSLYLRLSKHPEPDPQRDEELEEMQRRLSAMKGLVRQQEALITHLLGQLTDGQKS